MIVNLEKMKVTEKRRISECSLHTIVESESNTQTDEMNKKNEIHKNPILTFKS